MSPLTEHPAVGGEGEVGHAGVEGAAPGPGAVTTQNPQDNWNRVWLQEPGLVLLRLSAEIPGNCWLLFSSDTICY